MNAQLLRALPCLHYRSYMRPISMLSTKLCWRHRHRRARPLIFHANECNKTSEPNDDDDATRSPSLGKTRTGLAANGNSNACGYCARACTCTEEMGFLSITNLRQPSGPCPAGASLPGDVTIGYVHNGSHLDIKVNNHSDTLRVRGMYAREDKGRAYSRRIFSAK